MSEAIILTAEARKDAGKGASRRLRRADLVPAIIYGGEQSPEQITLAGKAIRKVLEADSFYSQILTIELEGKKQQAILKDVQRHPAKEFAMHLDFLRVAADQALTTNVPLRFLNEESCVGVKDQGGAITHSRVDVEVRCLPANLPEFIEVDMARVELGEHIHLSDLTLPEGVEFVAMLQGESHDLDVASVQATRATKGDDESGEAATEEAGAE